MRISFFPKYFCILLLPSHLYSAFFSESEVVKQDYVATYRESWANFQHDSGIFFVSHNPALLSVVSQFEQLMQQFEDGHAEFRDVVAHFRREVVFHKESHQVTPSWCEALPLRFLCATSITNASENDLMMHLVEPYPRFWQALSANSSWKSHSLASVGRKSHHHGTFDSKLYESDVLPRGAIQTIAERVIKLLPISCICFAWGQSQINVGTIVECLLDHRFPVGVPSTAAGAHGVVLSPYGFMMHDIFHMGMDYRQERFVRHVIELAEQYVANGGSIQHFMLTSISSSISRYHGVMNILKKIYGRIVQTLDSIESQQALLGLFWILHEEPNFPSVIYSLRNFEDILTIITEDVPASLRAHRTANEDLRALFDERASGVDVSDPFETSPLDGSTAWTDEQITAWVIKNKRIRDARNYVVAGCIGDDLIDKDEITNLRITRSPLYIDVYVSLRPGETLAYSFQTLLYMFNAIGDAVKIFQLAGADIFCPKLSGEADPRAAAKSFIKNSERSINGLITQFHQTALLFAREDIPGKSNLIEEYRCLYDESIACS